ncbi:uncharacterized protein [Rutidosis leptorrhynchoides]|uniref:uncharacterized protein n=1 Tax=Rutidosis leptorrhynchoides TaxID=125765 RepID=UPI003A9A6329
MLYGSECWPMTKAQERRMEVAEMRMLRWTCGKTMLDMIPNSVFRENLEVRSISDKLREGRLRWFGHVRRRPLTAPVRRVEELTVDGVRIRGRPARRWEDRIKMDLKELLLYVPGWFVFMYVCFLYVCHLMSLYLSQIQTSLAIYHRWTGKG